MARSKAELDLLLGQQPLQNTRALAARADAWIVGVGHIDETSPLVVDDFVSAEESRELIARGAAGEVLAWVYDENGRLIDGLINDRVSSAPHHPGSARRVTAVAHGKRKRRAILGALRGKLVNALITDEATAEAILALA